MIAELLCPKQERWNTILDFSVESIRFIGYPVSSSKKLQRFKRQKSPIISFNSTDSDFSLKPKEQIAAFNVVLAFEVDSKLLENIEYIKEVVKSISTL